MSASPVSTSSSTVDPIAVAKSLAPLITEHAKATDEGRRVPQVVIDAMVDAGLFHMYLPRDINGNEQDPITAAKAVEAVSAIDGSAGWCVMIAGQNAAFAGYMDPAAARSIWGPRDIVCGTARPIGRAVATNSPEAGFVVSGRWPFASGSSHATWFAGECLVYDGDNVRKTADGNDVTRMTVFPRESAVVHDTWDTTGLRGTASNDFSCDGVFVPHARGASLGVDPQQHPWALYRGLPVVFANHGSQALGVAAGAIAEARTIAMSKNVWGGVAISSVLRMQSVIAEATVLVDSARTYLYAKTGELWEEFQAGRDGTPELRANVRLATSHAARASVQAVDLLYQALATSAIMRSSPLERRFRDIHTAGAHVMVGQLTYEAAGRVALGRDAEFPFF